MQTNEIMPWTKEVCISLSTHTSSWAIFFYTRLWGLAPYSLRKNGDNFVLRWSLPVTIYSYILALMFVFGSVQGMISNIELDGTNSGYVVYFGSALGNIATIALMFGAPLRTAKLFRYIQCINQVDSVLEINDAKKARYISIVALIIIFLLLTAQVFSSVYFMALINPAHIIQFLPESIQQAYVPIIFNCLYAHMVYSIERRISIINEYLKVKIDPQVCEDEKARLSSLILNAEDFGSDTLNNKLINRLTENYGSKLAKTYSQLCNAVDIMNESFSYTVVIITISCLLKLTESLYYFIFMIFQNFPLGSLITQFFWNLTHFFRLLIIVEPCDRCLRQVNNLATTVNQLLGSTTNKHLHKQMNILLYHLTHRKMVFSVGGLGTFNHRFLTNFMSAVTTYLVIMIQFNQSLNGPLYFSTNLKGTQSTNTV